MSALISGLAHLFALLRDGLGWLRERARDAAIRAAERDRINAETTARAREAEHAAQDEMADAAGTRDKLGGRLRQDGF
jgi:hypothetical protein